MNDNVITVGIRTVMDISDVKANVGVLQNQFNKLKLPSGITDKFNQEISKFSNTYEKYQQKMAQGIKTKGDATQTSKYLNEIAREYDNIVKVYSKASGMDLKSMFKIDSGPLKDAAAEVEKLTKQLENVDIDKIGFKNLGQQLSGVLKNSKLSGEHGLINQMLGDFDKGKINEAKQALQEIQKEIEKRQYATTTDKNGNVIQKPGTYSEANTTAALNLVNQLMAAAEQAGIKIQDIQGPLNKATQNFDNLLNKGVTSFKNIGNAAQNEKAAVHGVVEENKNLVNSMASAQQQSQMLSNRIAMYFSLYEIIRKIGDVAKRAFQTVKELDASMTQTAVVTNFSVSDMWEQLPTYTAAANKLGSTINDVYKATTLYYQQGLNTNQAMGVATETLKMARIGGLEAAQATDMMTAALRGFNMQVNEMSAQRINDVYSKLAAITASNTEELGSAMTRTASIANSAGMQFETTSAFLAQMIETTREAPENLGTAMKTIVARFQEMKKAPSELVDSEGELLDANRVEKALKTIGVALRDTNGDFRELDQVFLEISAKWDSLSMGQQRYIATMAAGSRQQSRFIAMMSNYDRTMELVDAANNSAGASQEQFNKTLESMDTKLNKLKNAWDQFAMGLTNSTILKGAIDGLTGGITIINKFIDTIGKISPEPFKDINKSLLTLVGTLGALRLGGSLISKHGGLLSGLLQGAAGFFQGKSFGEIGQEISKSFNSPELIATVRAGSGEVSKSFYQGLYSNIQAEKGKIGQAISNSIQDTHYLTTINLADYLQLDNVSLADKGSAIIGALKAGLESNHDLSDAMRQKAEESLQAMEKQFSAGKSTLEHMLNSANGFAQKYNFQLDPKTIGVEQVNKSLLETGNILTTTGAKLQRFGNMLRNTPLEPFGKLLTIAGTALTSIGMTLTIIKAGIIKTTVSLAADTVAWLINTKAIDADTKALVKNNAVRIGKDGQIKEIKNAGQFLKNFAAQGGSVGTVLKGLAGKLTGVLGKLAGFAPQIIGITLAIASLHSAWKLLNWRTDQLKAAKTRAADAADQFSSIKQEVSELKDKLDELEEIDNSFENLVAGTAEFNEKLNESNALITELISKYPMLNDSKYLSTDKNGRLILNENGREQIQQELKQRQGNAQALSLMAAQDVKNFNSTGWLKDYDKARNKENANLARYGARYSKIARQENIAEMQARGERSSKDIFKAQKDEIAANYKTAITSLFSGFKTTDLVNKDKVANIFGESYENILKQTVADVKEGDRAKAYAKAYGYDEYLGKNKFRKGNEEVEIEKDIWNDETTNKRIKANEQIISSAETVDRTLDNLNGKVAGAFDDIKIESDTLISDILSSNIETNRDDLKAIIEEGNLKELTKDLTDEQIEALKQAGIDNLETTLKERGEAILEAQKQQDENLFTMMAKATGKSADWFSSGTRGVGEQIKTIRNELDALSTKEKNLLTTVGQGIEESLGQNNMGKFINTFIDGTQTVRNRLTSIVKDVDWTSSISALGAITKMTKSSVPEIRKLGQEMRVSAEGSHLLADSMQELFAAEDFTKVTENMDSFVNSSGRLDATGIQKMAQESGTLSKLLKTDAISAGGLAAALNATSISGVTDITSLNDSVLQLLSSFTQLDSAMAKAHDIVSNFDPGIDTGEGADFIKDAYEKAAEYMNNNEWGNEQLENYTKLIVGANRYTQELANNNGNVYKTIKSFKPIMANFKNGFTDAWKDLANHVDSTGKSIDDVKFKSKALKGIKIGWNKGDIDVDLGEATTKQFTDWIKKVYKVSDDIATLMLADFKNHSDTLRTELEANDFNAGIKNGDFYKANTVKATNGQEIVALSTSSLDIIAAATGKTAEDIRTAIKGAEQATGKDIRTLTNTYQKGEKKGELINNYNLLNKRLSNLTEGNKQNADRTNNLSWLKQFTKNNTVDINQAMQYGNRFLDVSQTQGMLYEAFKKMTQNEKDFKYNGEVIDPSEINSLSDFIDKLTKIEENENWNEVGQAIAAGYVEYMAAKKERDKKEKEDKERWDSDSQSKASTYEVQPGSSRILQMTPELAQAAANQDLDIGTRVGTFAKITEELKLTKTELADVNKGFIQLNMADLSTLSDEGLKKVFDGLQLTKEEVKSAKEDLNNFKVLTDKQKTIAIRTDISGEKKVSMLLNTIYEEWPGGADTTTKTLILQATARMAEGNKEGATELLEQAGLKGKKLKTVTKQIDFTVNAGLANPKEVQDSLDKEVDKAVGNGKDIGGKKAQIKKKVQIQYEENGKKPKTKSTITTGIKIGKDEATNKINQLKKQTNQASFDIKADDGLALKTINSVHKKARAPQSFDISANPIGTWRKDFDVVITKHKKEEATGVRQMGSVPSLPRFESLASGKHTTHLGTAQLGPRDQGGLTLTGELGYEVVWLPSKGKSMIVGANGPQMVNLPGDAVVWNHEQSKKILNQNSIPINSKAKGTTLAGSAANYIIDDNSSSKGGGGGGDNPNPNPNPKRKKVDDKNQKEIAKLLKKFNKVVEKGGKVSVWWDNQTRKVDAVIRKADQLQKKVDKLLTKATSTIDNIATETNSYINKLNQSIKLNKQSQKKATTELDKLNNNGKATISWDYKQTTFSKSQKKSKKYKSASKEYAEAQKALKKASKTEGTKDDEKAKARVKKAEAKLRKAGTTKKKTKKKSINIGQYIKYDKATDSYIIDQEKLDKVAKKNKSKAESIKEAANKKINEKTQKKNTAEDNIQKAQDQLDELGKKLYDTFYGWENSLTKIYILSKQLEEITERISVFQAKQSLSEAKLRSGKAFANDEGFLVTALRDFSAEVASVQQGVANRQEQIRDQKAVVSDLFSLDTLTASVMSWNDKLKKSREGSTEYITNKEGLNEAKEALEIAQFANKYLKKSEQNPDGTYNIDFDTEQFAKDKAAGNFTNTTGEKITEYVNKVIDENKNLINLYQEQLSSVQELYDQLSELNEQYADYSDTLVEAVKQQSQENVDKLDKLNTSLTNQLKNLLDDVKKRLDQRRQQEDNAKTESDIAKKQQRLATLRADTSGSHASEIQQLEQEIADAQQSYGRTIEDQTLQQLTDQADEAAKQRERQIALQQAMLEVSNANGTNIALVEEYLSDPLKYQTEIQELWRQNNDYYNQTSARQAVMDGEFETFFADVAGYESKRSVLEQTIKETEEDVKGTIDAINAMSELVGGEKVAFELFSQGQSLSDLLNQNLTIGSIVDGLLTLGLGQEDIKGQLTPEVLAKIYEQEGFTADVVEPLKKAGLSEEAIAQSMVDNGAALKDLKESGISAAVAKAINEGVKWSELFKAGYNFKDLQLAGAEVKDLVEVAKEVKKEGESTGHKFQQESGSSLKKTQQALTEAGITDKTEMANVKGEMKVNGKTVTSHINSKGTKEVANKGSTLYIQDYDSEKGNGTGKKKEISIEELTPKLFKQNKTEAMQALEYAIKHQKVGSVINKNIKELVQEAGIAGKEYDLTGVGVKGSMSAAGNIHYNDGTSGVKVWHLATGKITDIPFSKNKNSDFYKNRSSNNVKREYEQVDKKRKEKKLSHYLKGGLATQTGPAWLDGTRAKPEAVLSATDTKNFVALKDILSDVMNGVSSIQTSNVESGPVTYDIDINVDHLNNDYDVDKVAKRVEKIITQDSSYRNVTLVRKFR